MFCVSGIIRENSLTLYIFIYNYNNDFMKSLVKYINENYINEDLVTKEIKSYKSNMTFYHVSVKKITQDTLTDYPMFCFYDYKQAKALKHNVESDYEHEYSYKYKPSIYKFNIQGKILNFDETEKLINDDDLLTSLVENPDKKELKKLVKKIKRKINDDSVVAITILDYSQENYNDDAFSLLIFNPKESVKNFK